MIVFKIILGLFMVAVCLGFALCWGLSVQPDIASNQALRQMELHTNGTGDQLANERRLVTQTYHWPRYAACGVTLLLLIGLFWSEISCCVSRTLTLLE